MNIYARNGITTAQDGASSPETIGLMQAADAQGMINLDIKKSFNKGYIKTLPVICDQHFIVIDIIYKFI